MLILDSTTKSLEVTLNASPSTNLDFTASYVDITSTTYTPASSDGTISTVSPTATTIVSAPVASTQRQIKYISICNNDTSAKLVTVQINTSSVTKVVCKVTLDSFDTLQYTDSEGFNVIAFNSGIKNSVVAGLVLSAGTTSLSSGTLSISNSSYTHGHNVTFGMTGTTANTSLSGGNAVTVTASVRRAISASHFEVPSAKIYAQLAAPNTSNVLNFSLQRFIMPYDFEGTRLDLIAVFSASGAGPWSWANTCGFYTRNGSTLSLFTSASSSVQIAAAGASNNTNSYVGVSGTRFRSFSLNSWSFTPGEYWFGLIHSASATNSVSVTFAAQSTHPIGGLPGANNDVVGNSGLYTAATGAFPSTINPATDIFYCHTAATGQSVNKQPYFRMFGTFS